MPSHPPDTRALSPAQAAMWFGQQQVPHSAVYQCAERTDIHGDFDPDMFAAVLARCLGAIPALNARYTGSPDGPQSSPQPRDHTLRRFDLTNADDPDAACQAIIDETMDVAESAAEEISGAGLSDQCLIRVSPTHHIWVQRIHHLCIDGYSFAALLRWVAQCYTATLDGNPVPDLPFADTDVDSPAAGDAAFWGDYCRGELRPPSLTDVAHSATADRAYRVTRELSAHTVTRHGWAESTVAAVAVYTATLSAESDVVLGMPWANRRLGAAPTIEPAVNILPLRVHIDPTATVGGLIEAVIAEIRKVRPHSRYRDDQLRRDLGALEADRALYGPVVNVKFFTPALTFGIATGTVSNIAMGPVDDMTFTASPQSDGGLVLEVEANPQRYTEADTERHASRLVALLDEMTSVEPATPLGALTVADAEDVAEQIDHHNRTRAPMPDATLADLLVDSAARHHDRTAVIWADQKLSFGELFSAAQNLADQLMSRGAGPNTIVALRMPRSPETVLAILATILAGAAYLPIDPELPPDRINSILDDAAPVALLSTAGNPRGAGTDPDSSRWKWRMLSLHISGSATLTGRRRAAARPRDAAYVIFTSGSTGRPKGVVVEHRSIVNRLRWMDDTFRLTPDDRVLQKTPYSFDVSVWEFFWPLLTGATLVLAAPDAERDGRRLADELADHAITVCHFVPSAFEVYLTEPGAQRTPALRLVICSGEALAVETLRRAVGTLRTTQVHNLYGPTEAAVDITAWHPGPDWDERSVPIGLPVHNSAVYVLDNSLRPLPPGSVGELYLSGRQLARGYLRRSGLTATRFVANPFAPAERMYATGDLARRRWDGNIEYAGRIDDQVKIRGRRIELDEIATVLRSAPHVSWAVVVMRGTGSSAVLIGYAVPEGGHLLDVQDLRTQLARRLPIYMVPDAFVILDAIPTTPNGKLDRSRLPEPQLGSTEIDSPRDPLEMSLVSVFAAVTDRAEVSATDSFFDLGGNSLLAAQLAARATEVLNLPVTVADVFAAPSVSALARRLSGDDATDPFGPLLTLREPGGGVPLFCVHPAGGLGWCYTGLLAHLDRACAVYALQARGLNGDVPAATLTEVAQLYLDEVERVVPQGPIRLLGWSVGGVIAHEMALQAQSRGRIVSQLCLLDAYPSELWRTQPPPSAAEVRRAFLIMAGVDDQPLDSDDEMVGALRGAHTAFGTLDPERIRTISSIVIHFATLMRHHTTGVFDGDAVLFRALSDAQEFLDPSAWSTHITGDITQIDVPTTHPGMVRPPTPALIADALNGSTAPMDAQR